jgi:hypothetical protein
VLLDFLRFRLLPAVFALISDLIHDAPFEASLGEHCDRSSACAAVCQKHRAMAGRKL